MKTFPLPKFVAALKAIGVAQVSTEDVAAGPYPAVRVAYLYDQTPRQPWTTAVAQIDVWAPDPLDAGDLAFTIADEWQRLSGVLDGSLINGAWLDNAPRPISDTDTDAARFMLTVGLLICED